MSDKQYYINNYIDKVYNIIDKIHIFFGGLINLLYVYSNLTNWFITISPNMVIIKERDDTQISSFS